MNVSDIMKMAPIDITGGIPSEIYVAIGRGRYDNDDGSFADYELAKDVADAVRKEREALVGELVEALTAMWQWQRTVQELLPDGLGEKVLSVLAKVDGEPMAVKWKQVGGEHVAETAIGPIYVTPNILGPQSHQWNLHVPTPLSLRAALQARDLESAQREALSLVRDRLKRAMEEIGE